jgi:hypothetical protein
LNIAQNGLVFLVGLPHNVIGGNSRKFLTSGSIVEKLSKFGTETTGLDKIFTDLDKVLPTGELDSRKPYLEVYGIGNAYLSHREGGFRKTT